MDDALIMDRDHFSFYWICIDANRYNDQGNGRSLDNSIGRSTNLTTLLH
jgi:hypothetical protein